MSIKSHCKLEGEHLFSLIKGEEIIINTNGIEVHFILADIGFSEIDSIVNNAIKESMMKGIKF